MPSRGGLWAGLVLAVIASGLAGCCPTQIPIDAIPESALWVTIGDSESDRVIGYVLVTGYVEDGAIVTNKGKFVIEPVSETWFAADVPDIAIDPATVGGIEWAVEVPKPAEWQKQMAELINESTGLLDQAGDAQWDVKAPSDGVPWTEPAKGTLDDLPVFAYSKGRTAWYLALERDGDAFTRVVWASSTAPGTHTLPREFGQAGSLVMEATSRAAVLSVFDDHEVASP